MQRGLRRDVRDHSWVQYTRRTWLNAYVWLERVFVPIFWRHERWGSDPSPRSCRTEGSVVYTNAIAMPQLINVPGNHILH